MDIDALLAPVFKRDGQVILQLAEGMQVVLPFHLQREQGKSRQTVPEASLVCTIQWQYTDDLLRVEARVHNAGSRPLLVQNVRIVLAATKRQAKAQWMVYRDAGECAWCGVKRLDALEANPRFGVIEAQRTGEAKEQAASFHRSSLQTVLYDGQGKHAWLVGFLRQRHGFNWVDVHPDEKKQRVAQVDAWQEIGTLLQPKAECQTDPLVVMSGVDPLDLMEVYAGHVQAHIDREFVDPPLVGMMTWYGYATAIDRDIILENADMVAELFSGYPQPMRNFMLLDHGWQEDANWGYWDEADKKRFPEGMKWLGDQLRQKGMELALWYTPFCITQNAPNLAEIEPLRALDKNGEPEKGYACVWGQLPGHPSGNWLLHFFDGALDAVQAKWGRELNRMAKEWGCVYWKMDFFNLITSAARQATNPVGELYARTYDTFRQAVGEKGHLAPCSCSTNIQLGYNDSVRIAADIGVAGTSPSAMESYTHGFTTIGALWYKNRRFWVNDADSIQIGRGCGLNEARVRATTVAFSGGHSMVSEDLRGISPDRLEIIKRILPAYSIAARPIDLYEHIYPEDIPHIWRLPVQSNWGAKDAVAIFNLTKDVMRVQVQPEWFGLAKGEPFGAMEWWQQRWLGRFDGAFEIVVPPADVVVLHAQNYKQVPWLVSTSHHFSGGWIVENVHFDETSGELRGDLVTRAGLRTTLTGTLPEGWTLHYGAHNCANGAGGWTQEVQTTSQRTAFIVNFVRR